MAPEQIVYEFGDFRLDPGRQLLTCSGSVVPLKARAFDLLVYFAEHPGELVDKAALMRAVWPNVVVEENNLSQHLSALRQALGDGVQGRQFIVTVPRRGYRFVADVGHVNGTKDTATEVVASVPSAAGPSVAVLPFANLSGDPEKEYFGDGMADELIHLLSRVPGLKVPARTSSFAYKGKNLHVRDIARDLGVAAVLEGSVRSAAELIRVTVQLIDAASGYQFWSHSYEREFRDIFKLQDEIANAILESLCLQMNVVLQAPARRAPTTDPAAYQLYLQGLSMGNLMTAQSQQRAVEMFRRATELDPKFAAAFAAIAYLRLYLSMFGLPDAIEEAERAAETALALDPGSGEAHAALGQVGIRRGAWLRAAAHIRAAQELGHRSDMLHSHFTHLVLPVCVGHIRSTVRVLLEDFRAAPALPYIQTLLAAASVSLPLAANATRQALDYAELAVDLGMPRNAGPLPLVRSYAALRLGRHDDAMRAAQDLGDRLSVALAAAGGAEVIRVVHAALASGENGSNAVQALDAIASAVPPEQIGPEMSMHVLAWYTMLGQLDRAYGFVERVLRYALPLRTLGLFLPWIWIPELLPFRQDPRFQGLVTRLGLIPYWEKFGPPDNCELRDGRLICH